MNFFSSPLFQPSTNPTQPKSNSPVQIEKEREMKSCELCKFHATTYCESDQASLCWDCDAKVHGANFLVARHLRCLLCHTCQSPTPWKASGARLGHTVSVCESCSLREEESQDEYDEDDSEDDDPREEDGENQVVPWSTLADASPAPPAVSDSSSSGNSGGGDRDVSASVSSRTRKRVVEEVSASRSREIAGETGELSGESKRRFRERRVKHVGGLRSAAVMESGEEPNHTIDLNFPEECWRPI